MSDAWPKPWSEIYDYTGDPVHRVKNTYIDMGPLRLYRETAYINADGGRETDENRDLWLPLERYLRGETDG